MPDVTSINLLRNTIFIVIAIQRFLSETFITLDELTSRTSGIINVR